VRLALAAVTIHFFVLVWLISVLLRHKEIALRWTVTVDCPVKLDVDGSPHPASVQLPQLALRILSSASRIGCINFLPKVVHPLLCREA